MAVPESLRNLVDSEQVRNARIIIETCRRRYSTWQVQQHAAIVATSAAIQESSLRNLAYGDRDSVGLFQQRPSHGWGTVEELTDPPTATQRFLDALDAIDHWQDKPIGEVDQMIQNSGHPEAYDDDISDARLIVYALWDQLYNSTIRN